MCGIVAIYCYEKNCEVLASKSEIISMNESMLSRGPDACGYWFSKDHRIGLAHRRLSIIDLTQHADQPMIGGQGSIVISFNGEIYNYKALRKILHDKGYSMRTNSDTEVLLLLYEAYSFRMLDYIRGMFAFVIWDARIKKLFIARDPFGIKPLYYADDGKVIRIASQVKALLQSKSINRTPEAAGHVGFFLLGNVPEPFTFFQGIKAFPPGSFAFVDSKGLGKVQSFYSIKKAILKSTAHQQLNNRNDAKKYLCHAFNDSIKHHLQSDVPVCLFLSSGLDSSVIAGLLAMNAVNNVTAITLGFDRYKKNKQNEVESATIIAKHYNLKHIVKYITQQEFQLEFEHIIKNMDQPTIDGVNTYFVSRLAAQMGFKVALSGLGGDEVFRGYNSFKQIPMLVRLLSCFPACEKIGVTLRNIMMAKKIKSLSSPKYLSIFEYGNKYSGAYLLRRGLFMPWELEQFFDHDFLKKGLSDLNLFFRLESAIDGIKQAQEKVQSLELLYYMRNQLLRDTDWASMAHSLEIRVPFIDPCFFEKVKQLPKSWQKKTKMIKVLKKPLPKHIINAKKKGFDVPIMHWLNNAGDNQSACGFRQWAKVVYENIYT
jgi:asparagine synthase (glutamine-hydrolysing)